MHGSPAANYALQQSDCIIGIGARFDDRTTGCTDKYAPLAKSKKSIINVNIEHTEFNKTLDTDINIHLDSNNFLKYLNTKINSNKLTNEWNVEIKELKKNHYFKYNELDENGKLTLKWQLIQSIIIVIKGQMVILLLLQV